MSRITSQLSTATSSIASGVTRSLSVKTNNKPVAGRNNPLPPSDIKLFVTNLRLLDLDLCSDWPNITVQTFSSKNADQKQRIGASEWALFRLFEIWDPAETSQKLQPFFPPLEPLQSRNLRIALHRSLDTLKKDGVLGRESVLRKTMLDECKGDKFYEILYLFSTAVLKKVLAKRAARKKNVPAIARTLANAPNLSKCDQESLIPLSIVHKAALVNVLKRKEEKRRRFVEFEEQLNAKADSINQRLRKSKETPRSRKPEMPQKEIDSYKRKLKDNWIGNQKWIDVMLQGDDVQAEDAFLTRSFKTVWRTVEQGRELEGASPDMGLMENLQLRVQEQQTRLSRWQSFHANLQAQDSEPPSQVAQNPIDATKEFRFDDHLQFQLRDEVPVNGTIQKAALRPEIEDILSEMDEELSRVATERPSNVLTRQRRSTSGAAGLFIGRLTSRPNGYSRVPSIEQPRSIKTAISGKGYQGIVPVIQPPKHYQTRNLATPPVDSETTLVATVGKGASTSHASELFEQPPSPHEPEQTSDPLPVITSPTQLQQPTNPSLPSPAPSPSPSSSPPPPPSYFPSEPPVLEPPQLTSEETLAAQIVSTIGDATPSPVKRPQPRLSLMERTRMSMSHAQSFQPIPESPALPSPSLPTAYEDEEDEHGPLPTTDLQRKQSLLERTRLSMAAMQPPTHKPRASLAPPSRDHHSRKSSRQSTFPVNQFDTPRSRKSIQAIEEAQREQSGERTPKEDLFSDEVDYERVFKSRPKIATSPIFGTPVFDANGGDDEFDEGVTGVDLADVDADDDEDLENAWENSPSKARGLRRGRNIY
ncbi:hypothetical protein DM02DRAFT_732450 [Periconia macrospinosa]|uniref:HAUS augmin-like complex subunit 6 N-terminal domain-containing protein n=1 Tax=Periconia macrospinosa TaxID=97972 RepID=A0A2V1DAF8_9PLEO|nr:hypothetical protein DM02DRAFT_732450 [Periconia macrospinosa]